MCQYVTNVIIYVMLSYPFTWATAVRQECMNNMNDISWCSNKIDADNNNDDDDDDDDNDDDRHRDNDHKHDRYFVYDCDDHYSSCIFIFVEIYLQWR